MWITAFRNCEAQQLWMRKHGKNVTVIDGLKLSLDSWFDNKNVNLLSAYIESEPTKTNGVMFDKKKKV